MNSATRAGQTVTVIVRGHLLDSAAFPTAESAEVYKRTVRAWALERRVPVQLLCHQATK